MTDYEEMKSQLLSYLYDYVDAGQLGNVSEIIDNVMCDYTFKKNSEIVKITCANGDIVRDYLIAKTVEGCSDGTLRNYRYILNILFSRVQKDINEIDASDLRNFMKQYKQEKCITDATLDKYREAICWFFKWCHAEGRILKNPTFNLKPVKHEIRERKVMTRIELEIIRDACADIRERAIIEFLYSTACRVSELCSLKKSDVNMMDRTVKIFGKGRKERTSYLNAKCYMTLIHYLESRNDNSEYLFVNKNAPHNCVSKVSVERLVKKIQSRTDTANRIKITPHSFRHASATLALHSGMDGVEIQRFLGHSKLDTTMRYAHVSQDDVMMSHRKHVV